MSYARLSPDVQRVQSQAPYIDIYTNAVRNPLRRKAVTPELTLEPERWTGGGGYGSRHMHDKAPFSLWDDQRRRFLTPKKEQIQWIDNNFDVKGMGSIETYIWIETDNPPKPVPLTLGCMPVLFVGMGEVPHVIMPTTNFYPNPRLPDPCPDITWPVLSNPSKEQSASILTALEGIVEMEGIIYLPQYTVVELIYGDGRVYGNQSLPGKVAGRNTLYHHSATRYFDAMEDLKRRRRLDPAAYNLVELGSMPQDDNNYLRAGEHLTPGNRVESGRAQDTGNEDLSFATSAGVKLRHPRGHEVLTVAHHAFKLSSEVWYPYAEMGDKTGDKIGDVIESIPELNISLVRLTSYVSDKFTNRTYFQAEAPVRLLEAKEIIQGSWSEIDGMSSGLVSLQAVGEAFLAPSRPPEHPKISFSRWRPFNLYHIFGAVNTEITDGLCGAPIVSVDGGGVQGFFHLSNGTYALSAHLDDLVAEGWSLA